eukprot:scaffold39600_cov46-Cyclotella_meneghiniana.AAC.3
MSRIWPVGEGLVEIVDAHCNGSLPVDYRGGYHGVCRALCDNTGKKRNKKLLGPQVLSPRDDGVARPQNYCDDDLLRTLHPPQHRQYRTSDRRSFIGRLQIPFRLDTSCKPRFAPGGRLQPHHPFPPQIPFIFAVFRMNGNLRGNGCSGRDRPPGANQDGTPTGNVITQPLPYKNTTLRRELAGLMLNNRPLFYTGVVTAVGSDTGIPRLVYPYNPNDQANVERQKRVRHIASNMSV